MVSQHSQDKGEVQSCEEQIGNCQEAGDYTYTKMERNTPLEGSPGPILVVQIALEEPEDSPQVPGACV